MNVTFTSEEKEAIEYTIKELEWWANEGWQYTMTNCEANQQTVGEIIMRLSGIVQDEKPPTCRYQISLLNALNKFDIFYEAILLQNESMAKHIKHKYDQLREYTKDTYKPGEPDLPAPEYATDWALELARALKSVLEKTQTEQDITPDKGKAKIGWPWKLYEKTLKVIVDAVLDRLWPK